MTDVAELDYRLLDTIEAKKFFEVYKEQRIKELRAQKFKYKQIHEIINRELEFHDQDPIHFSTVKYHLNKKKKKS
ncbi:hypothetical protein ACFFHM_03260 [Halalkalibacter kiskunsagensis]|uniref:Uncharacterized protein n=1 Tax=Halalkalibacter kiskunsagensis TaxID=1548599 RepID=A0ABV6K8D9_9BACI